MNWNEEELFDVKLIHAEPPEQVIEQQQLLMKELYDLPVHRDNFGLIHSGLHHRNFHYHNGQIWVFDFDDCSNHWFAIDLAIPLYYLMWSFEQKGVTAPNDYAVKFMRELLNGYDTENQLTPADIDAIPLFLKLRDLSLYSFFYLKNKDSKNCKTNKKNQPIFHFDSNIGIR